MRVIIYCRVSSDEQKENTSLDYQERVGRAYCNNHHYEVIDCYKEDYSAKNHTLVRPEMKKIYDYCKKHKNSVDMVLFLRWDRFSRNAEFAFTYIRKFNECGTVVNSIETPIDFNSPDWSTLIGVYCGNAQAEDTKISTRTKQGIRETLRKGCWANKAPRGYKNERISKSETHLKIDEHLAPKIRNIFNEVAKGVEAPCKIRRRLCKDFSESAFLSMLRNVVYIGKIRVPATKDEPEQIVQGEHEAIIDEQTFYKVQDILSGKRKATPKLTKTWNPDLYLRKFLVCPVCGHSITGSTSKGNGGLYTYYHCSNKGQHLRIKANEVNESFAKYVGSLKPNKEVLALYKAIINDIKEDNNKDRKKEIALIHKEQDKIAHRIAQVEDKFADGELSKEDFDRMIARYTKESKDIKNKIEMLENINKGDFEPKLEYSMSLISNLEGFFKEGKTETKIKLLGSIFPEKIEFDGKNYRTNSFNEVLNLIFLQTKQLRGTGQNKSEEELSLPRFCTLDESFFEPFMRDLNKLWELRYWIPNPNIVY